MEHILVVEDEKEIAEAIQIYLEEEGYQVTICLESKNAMEIIQKQNIKLALLDVMMPNIDGIKIGGLEINDKTKKVKVEGELVKLTPMEYKVLYFLASNKGQVFSIKQIYENVWEEPFDGYEKKVVVHICHIRDKIEINPKEPKYLKAVWGLGYKIEKGN